MREEGLAIALILACLLIEAWPSHRELLPCLAAHEIAHALVEMTYPGVCCAQPLDRS
jgi:hypothetical protein